MKSMRWVVLVVLSGFVSPVFAECTAKQKATMVKLGLSLEDIRKQCALDSPQSSQPVASSQAPARPASSDPISFGFGLQTVQALDGWNQLTGRVASFYLAPARHLAVRYMFGPLNGLWGQYDYSETALLLSTNSNTTGLSLHFAWSPLVKLGAAEGTAQSLGFAANLSRLRLGYEMSRLRLGLQDERLTKLEVSVLF